LGSFVCIKYGMIGADVRPDSKDRSNRESLTGLLAGGPLAVAGTSAAVALSSLGPLAELRSLVDAVYGRALKADTAQRRLRWRGRRHANDTDPAYRHT
jgi:hypothetical protein